MYALALGNAFANGHVHPGYDEGNPGRRSSHRADRRMALRIRCIVDNKRSRIYTIRTCIVAGHLRGPADARFVGSRGSENQHLSREICRKA